MLLQCKSLLIVVLIVGACFAGGCTKKEAVENRNQLALGARAKTHGPVSITLIEPTDLTGLSPEQIMATRKQLVDKRPELLDADYNSWPILFARITTTDPWVSILGLQYEGVSGLCSKGLSNESLTLFNPLALVSPHFFGLSMSGEGFEWDPAKVKKDQVTAPQFPLYLKMRSLEWNAAEAVATSTYDVGDYLNRVNQYLKAPLTEKQAAFFLSAYNGADFNFRYIFFSSEKAKNISTLHPMSAPAVIRDILASRQLIGDGPSCNVVSRLSAQMTDISLTGLPAELPVRLWKAQPKSAEDAPDMTFVLSFR